MSTILVVEASAISRAMIASVLTREGHTVLEAASGKAALESLEVSRPDLIVQDVQLPDLECAELRRRLGVQSDGAEIPIIGLLSFSDRDQFEKQGWTWFTDYLFRPLAPFELRKVVAANLSRRQARRPSSSALRRVLIVDDDAVQLKLSTFRLSDAAYHVSTAVNGAAALEEARKLHPDAIVSDVLMPIMDGFQLCLAIRTDPELAGTPVVLTSSAFVEEADRALAAEVGANALVVPTADHQQILDALAAGLEAQTPAVVADRWSTAGEHYMERMIHQLERQAGLNAKLLEKLAIREAQIGFLSAAADVLTRSGTSAEVLHELLRCAIEAAGMSHGAVYLLEDFHGIALRAQWGFESTDRSLRSLFGSDDLLLRVMESQNAVVLPGPSAAAGETDALLANSGLGSMLILPIPGRGGPPGILCLGSRRRIEDLDSRLFADAIASQLGQSIALSEAFAHAAGAETMYREMFENSAEGIFRLSADGQILTANPALAHILGYENPQELIAYVADWAGLATDPAQGAGFLQRLGEELELSGVEIAVRRRDGTEAALMTSARVILDERGTIRCYECLAQDISERKRTQQLERLQQEHRAQLEWKDQLLSHVSHELRSPLATIHQFVALVHDGIAGPLAPEQRSHLAMALSNVGELRKLISDLLECSRAQSMNLTISPCRYRIEPLIEDVRASVAPLADEKGLEVSTDVDGGLPPLHGDPQRLRQVLINLVENAIRHTPPGGRIWIRAGLPSPHAEFLNIVVEDNGPGIEPEDQTRIFEQLYQGRAASEESRKGLGLGLYLCKQWVDRQGGNIWVESRRGTGSRFTFTVPTFSVARMIAPICTGDNLNSGSLVLIGAEVSPLTRRPLSERDEVAVDSAWHTLSSCMLPDLDVLLPRLGPAGDRETFVVVCFAKPEGVEVLSRRIRAQLGKNTDLTRAGLGFDVSTETIPVPHGETLTIDYVAACVSRKLDECIDPRAQRRVA